MRILLSKLHDLIQIMLVQHNDMCHVLTSLKNEKIKESDMSDIQKVNNVWSTSNKESTIVKNMKYLNNNDMKQDDNVPQVFLPVKMETRWTLHAKNQLPEVQAEDDQWTVPESFNTGACFEHQKSIKQSNENATCSSSMPCLPIKTADTKFINT